MYNQIMHIISYSGIWFQTLSMIFSSILLIICCSSFFLWLSLSINNIDWILLKRDFPLPPCLIVIVEPFVVLTWTSLVFFYSCWALSWITSNIEVKFNILTFLLTPPKFINLVLRFDVVETHCLVRSLDINFYEEEAF